MRKCFKCISFRLIIAIAAIIFLLPICHVKAETPITNRDDLVSAINMASADSTIWVGSIDFDEVGSTGLYTSNVEILLTKNLTIKGAEKVTFTNGYFEVKGLNSKITVCFENITFKSRNDEYQAINVVGNSEINVTNCLFDGYVNNAVNLSTKTVYSANQSIKASFTNCTFKDNNKAINAFGVGKNIILLLDNCLLEENSDGALQLSNIITKMEDITIVNNEATSGGAIYANNCEMELFACKLLDNEALENGGAFYLFNTKGLIDGCEIKGNKANDGSVLYVKTDEVNPVYIVNSKLANNISEKETIKYHLQSPTLTNGIVQSVLCTYVGNQSNMGFDNAMSDIAHVSFIASIIIDDTMRSYDEITEDYVPWIEEMPSSDNNYNYLASSAQAISRGVLEEDVVYYSKLVDVPKDVLPKIANSSLDNTIGNIKIGCITWDNISIALYDGEEKTGNVALEYGEVLTIAEPTKKGYTFIAWETKDGKIVNFEKPLYPQDVKLALYAKFRANEYKLTTIIDGETKEYSFTYGEEIKLEDAAKKGYKFLGWFSENGEAFINDGSYDKDITLYAQFKKNFPVALVVSLSTTALIIMAGGLFFILWRKKKPHVVLETNKQVDVSPDLSMLTEREREVFDLLLEGKKRNEIGKILCLSENTIKKQISSIYRKLNITTRNELFSKYK